MNGLLCFFTLLLMPTESGTQPLRPDFNPCVSKTNCGECIGLAASCAWCQKEVYTSNRCDMLMNHVTNGCDNSTDLVNPENEVIITKEENVRDVNADDPDDRAIQIHPQRLSLKLRPNKPVKIPVKFRQASNYPVDVYFLMDLSQSMADDQAKTAALAVNLTEKMLELTNNVRFGFGTFVDKVALPFTSTEPSKLKAPCQGCKPPYSFRHLLTLTANTTRFKNIVSKGEISGNLDAPEGGLDAMMQVAVCRKEIGWRDVSRKLLIYSSDAAFHSAGDGKLAGIVLPNDAQCHLDHTGNYTAATKQDYPSVGQMREIIREKKINTIFAVPKQYTDIYKGLSSFLEGSTVGTLADDSSNIVNLVRDNYKKISSTVELRANNTAGLTFLYHSACLGSTLRETHQCEGVKIGQEVTFEVEIEAPECPADPALRRREITIGPVGLIDSLTVDLEIICECDCQTEGIENSPVCSDGNGTFACGVCECNEGRRGRLCECGDNRLAIEYGQESCQRPNSSLVCSGHGECVCGECHCNARSPNAAERGNPTFSGKYCECDDYSCDLFKGMLCGGPTRGRCQCGVCSCHVDYVGTACDCPTSQNTCFATNGEICNGHGECNCGKCKCDKESRCYGDFCEHCPSCVGNCNCNKDCVNCRLFKKGIYSAEECENKCGNINITEVDLIEDNDNGTVCQEVFSDQKDCTFKFSYEYGPDNKLRIKAQKAIVCPGPVDLFPIILGVVGSVLVGIISLVIWKICVTVYDRREYSRFKGEIDNARWASEQNPLYRGAITEYPNPMCDTQR